MMKISYSRGAAALAAIIAVTLPFAARANTGGVRIIVQQWNPATPAVQKDDIVLDKPGLLGDALDQGWAEARTPVCDALKTEAGQPNRLGPGFSLYNMECTMAPSGTLSITSISGNLVSMSYRLPGNMFKGTSTQPTAAGSYADPCGFFHYDLVAKTVLHLDTLAVDAFTAGTENVSRPDSCNTAGDIAKFAAAALHFFGGPDFVAIAQHALERTQGVSTAKLNAAVASFATPVQTYSRQYALRQNWVRHGDLYFAFAPTYTPQPRTQAMSGGIRIAKNQWLSSVPQCGMFSVTGYVQTGPNPVTDPERLTVGTAPGADVGVSTTSGSASDIGDHYSCTYVEHDLPGGVPIAFRGHGTAGPQRGHVQDEVGIAPDGWSGTVALSGNLANKNFTATLAPQLVGFGEKVNLGARVNPVDPANGAEARTNPLILQSTTAVGNPAARVALNPQPLPPKVADTLTQGGITLFARGDFAGAADAFSRALTANPNNAIALHDLAAAHVQLGKTELAKSEFQRASDLAKTQGDLGTSKASQSAIIIVSGRH
jgi:Tetratricopeptide repeat